MKNGLYYLATPFNETFLECFSADQLCNLIKKYYGKDGFS